jgi:hypothetical protein
MSDAEHFLRKYLSCVFFIETYSDPKSTNGESEKWRKASSSVSQLNFLDIVSDPKLLS